MQEDWRPQKLVWSIIGNWCERNCVFFMCPISLAILIFYFASSDDSVWGSLVLVFLHLHQSGNLWFVFSHLVKRFLNFFYNISMDSIDFFLTLWLILQFAKQWRGFIKKQAKWNNLSCFIILLEFLGLICKQSNHNLSFWRLGGLTVCCLSVSNCIEYYIFGCWAGPKKTIETCDLSSLFWLCDHEISMCNFLLFSTPKKCY